MMGSDPTKNFEDVTNAVAKPLEKDIPTVGTALAASAPTHKKITRIKAAQRDRVEQMVATMSSLGFTKNEAAAMITKELYPNGEDEFTPKQYTHWLNNLKFHKLAYFGYYSREGVVLDIIDLNDSLKMVYQNALRQFRRECIKTEKPDKGYIIKLGYLIKDLSESRRDLIFSVPFVHAYKTVIDKTKGVLDDAQERYPSLFEVSNTGDTVLKVSGTKSTSTGNVQKDDATDVSKEHQGQEAGTTGSTGDVQGDTDNRSVSQDDGAAGASSAERIF